MYYICIENNRIVGIQNYEPQVPPTVSVCQVSDEQYELLKVGSHIFDIETRQISANINFSVEKLEIDKKNSVEREYLNSTDWMILRHLRQKTLGIDTSLTEDQFRDLEITRQEAALRIIS